MTGKGKHRDRPAITKNNPVKFGKYEFYPGAKLEAMDFLKNWYPARVMKVKEDDRKVLVHFEGWNQRYDEWMPFSSEKMRPLMRQSGRHNDNSPRVKEWRSGDAVLARWSDAKFYPAEVTADLDDGSYRVKFYDGFEKVITGSSLKRDTKKSREKERAASAGEDASASTPGSGMRSKRRHIEPIAMADFVTEIKKPKSRQVTPSRAPLKAPKQGATSKAFVKRAVPCSSSKSDSSPDRKDEMDSTALKESPPFTKVKAKQPTKPSLPGPSRENAKAAWDSESDSSDISQTSSPSKALKLTSQAGAARSKQVLKVKFFPQGRKRKRNAGKKDVEKRTPAQVSAKNNKEDAEEKLSESKSIDGAPCAHDVSVVEVVDDVPCSVAPNIPSVEPPSDTKAAAPKLARLKYTKSKLEIQRDKSLASKKQGRDNSKERPQKKTQDNDSSCSSSPDVPLKELMSEKKKSDYAAMKHAASSFTFSPEDDEKLSLLKPSQHVETSLQGESNEALEAELAADHPSKGNQAVDMCTPGDKISYAEIPNQVIILDEDDQVVAEPVEAPVAVAVLIESVAVPKKRRVRSRRPRRDMEIASMVVHEWPSTKRTAAESPSQETLNEATFVTSSPSTLLESNQESRIIEVSDSPSTSQLVPDKIRRQSQERVHKQNMTARVSPLSYSGVNPDAANPHASAMMMPVNPQMFQTAFLPSPVECQDPYCTVMHHSPPGQSPHGHVRLPYMPASFVAAPTLDPSTGQYSFANDPRGVAAFVPLSMPADHHGIRERNPNLPCSNTNMRVPQFGIAINSNSNQMRPLSSALNPPNSRSPDNVGLLQITKVESRAKPTSTPEVRVTSDACLDQEESGLSAKVKTTEFKVKKKRLDLITNKLTAQKQTCSPGSEGNSPRVSPTVKRSLSDPELYPRANSAELLPPPGWPTVSSPFQNEQQMIRPPPPPYGNPMNVLPANHPAAAQLMNYAAAYRDGNTGDGVRPMTVLSTNLLYAQPPVVTVSSPRFPTAMQPMIYPGSVSQAGYMMRHQLRPSYTSPTGYPMHPPMFQYSHMGPFDCRSATPNFTRPHLLSGQMHDGSKRHPVASSTTPQQLRPHYGLQYTSAEGAMVSLVPNSSQTSQMQLDALYASGRMKFVPASQAASGGQTSENVTSSGMKTNFLIQDKNLNFNPLLLAGKAFHDAPSPRFDHSKRAVSGQPERKLCVKNDGVQQDKQRRDQPSDCDKTSTTAQDQAPGLISPPVTGNSAVVPRSPECSDALPTATSAAPSSHCEESDGAKRVRKLSDKVLAPKEFVVQVDLNEFKCNVADCDKSFRKPHLLEYHLKYFHSPRPEEMKRKRSTPSLSSPESGGTKPMLDGATLSKRQHNLSESQDSKQPTDRESADSSQAPIVVDDVTSECERVYSEDEDSTADSDDSEGSEIDDVIRCKCHEVVEQGFMIQCEQCLTWQHGDCVGLAVSTVPSKYLCYICKNPRGLRASAKYDNDFDWYRLGRLPQLTQDASADVCQASSIITSTHALMEDIFNIHAVLRGIQLKLATLDEPSTVKKVIDAADDRRRRAQSAKDDNRKKSHGRGGTGAGDIAANRPTDVRTPGGCTNDNANVADQINTMAAIDKNDNSIDSCTPAQLKQYLSLLDETEHLERQLESRMDSLEKLMEALEEEYRQLKALPSKESTAPESKASVDATTLHSAELRNILKQLSTISKLTSCRL